MSVTGPVKFEGAMIAANEAAVMKTFKKKFEEGMTAVEEIDDAGQFIVEGTHVIGLSLSYAEITTFPKTFSELKYLKVLKVDGLGLKKLPEAIGTFSGLEELVASGNEITVVPDWVGGLKKLKVLDVSENMIKSIPAAVGGCESLEELKAGVNEITAVAPEVCGLKKLRVIELPENKVKTLPDAIGGLTSLKTLDLSGNELKKLPDSIYSLKLEEIDVGGAPLDADTVKKLEALGTKGVKVVYGE